MMQTVIETIQGTLGNAYEIEFQETEKNNGRRRPAVIIREREKTACPVVYTDGLPEALKKGEISPEKAAREIIESYQKYADAEKLSNAFGSLQKKKRS